MSLKRISAAEIGCRDRKYGMTKASTGSGAEVYTGVPMATISSLMRQQAGKGAGEARIVGGEGRDLHEQQQAGVQRPAIRRRLKNLALPLIALSLLVDLTFFMYRPPSDNTENGS